ncbi:hypothetical protein M9Y10_007479, partial [Tritrichomonas musculus]
MLDDLRKQPPTLKPLPDDAKPYTQILFEKENQELLEYFEKFGHEFKSIDEENLKINEPYDELKALECLEKARSKHPKDSDVEEKNIDKDKNKDPIVVYYLNKIHKLEDIFQYLDNVMFKQEIKPFKLTFEIGGVFEIPEKNVSPESDPEFTYEPRPVTVTSHQFANTIQIVIQFQQDLDRVKYYIESNLYNHTTFGASN